MDYLLGTMVQWHKRRASLIARQKRKIEETIVMSKSKKKKSKKKGKKKKKKVTEDPVFTQALSVRKQRLRKVEFEFETMRLEAQRAMCRAIFHFLAALRIEGVAPSPPTGSLLDMRSCFEKRFEVFTNLRQPQMLTYEKYVRACDLSTLKRGKETETLLDSSTEWFNAAKTCCEKILSARSVLPGNIDLSAIIAIMKTSVANRISLTCIKQGLESKKSLGKCTVSYKYHPSWCVLSVELI